MTPIRKFIESQFPNIVIMAPFVMAAGIVLYFLMPFEPRVPYPYLISLMCAAAFGAVIGLREKLGLTRAVLMGAAALFAFGFFYATGFSHNIGAPKLARVLRGVEISGQVTALDYSPDKTRMHIKTDSLNIRITTTDAAPGIGDTIATTAVLFPPNPPDAPGSFDFARWAFFNNLDATGYATSEIKTAAPAPHRSINNVRDYMHRRANPAGATETMLVDSLVLGQNRAIPPDDNAAVKSIGLSHAFSISGLHLTLIGGWLFAFFYLLCRAAPAITRKISARIPAIVCTWVCLLFYLYLSGAGVATQRAFAMATVGFAALLFFRNVVTLRNVALTFGLLLIMNPANITSAGFQLSFAAIFGIVYFIKMPVGVRTLPQKVFDWACALLKTSFIAIIFTTPFVAYHFGIIPTYGILGNLLCLPLFSFALMPLVIIGSVAALFGIYAPLNCAAYIYEIIINIAAQVGAMPGAQIRLPQMPVAALLLIVFGGLILTLVIGRARRAGIIPIAAAVALMIFAPKPIFYATADHELVAFMTDNGILQFNKRSASNHYFAFDSWNKINGTETIPREQRRTIGAGFAGQKYSVTCADKVCIYKTPLWNLAYVQQFVPLYKNINKLCVDADTKFIATYFNISAPNCGGEILRSGFVIYESGKIKYTPKNRIWHQ